MARRRTVRPRKKARSAAQKAATRKMLAANRARSGGSARPAKRRRSAKRRTTPRTTVVVASAPARRRSPSRKRAAPAKRRSASRRSASRRSQGGFINFGGSLSNAVIGNVKTAVVMGGGALAFDLLMGQVNKVLPTGWDTERDGDEINYKNAAAKAAVTIGVGVLATKMSALAPIRKYVQQAALGSLTIQAYNVVKSVANPLLTEYGMPLGGYVPMPRQQMRGPARPMIPLSVSNQGTTLNGAPLNKQAYYTPSYVPGM
jgi:hypothetical protein